MLYIDTVSQKSKQPELGKFLQFHCPDSILLQHKLLGSGFFHLTISRNSEALIKSLYFIHGALLFKVLHEAFKSSKDEMRFPLLLDIASPAAFIRKYNTAITWKHIDPYPGIQHTKSHGLVRIILCCIILLLSLITSNQRGYLRSSDFSKNT